MNASPATGTVLYVEDEECDRLFMQTAFERAGLREAFRVVVNGREAVDYLNGDGDYADRRQYPVPAVVLLDLKLPVLHGFDVLKWMRTQPALTVLPVVIFSSSKREEDKVKARDLGANEFVEKPTSGLLFKDVVQLLKEKFLTCSAG